MEFKDVVELFTVFRKLHTSTVNDDKTIFYRDVNNMHGSMTVHGLDGSCDVFDLRLISHMSLSSWDGLLVQYDTLDGRRMYPYRLLNVKDISIVLD